jgi:hypothetical protein
LKKKEKKKSKKKIASQDFIYRKTFSNEKGMRYHFIPTLMGIIFSKKQKIVSVEMWRNENP